MLLAAINARIAALDARFEAGRLNYECYGLEHEWLCGLRKAAVEGWNSAPYASVTNPYHGRDDDKADAWRANRHAHLVEAGVMKPEHAI